MNSVVEEEANDMVVQEESHVVQEESYVVQEESYVVQEEGQCTYYSNIKLTKLPKLFPSLSTRSMVQAEETPYDQYMYSLITEVKSKACDHYNKFQQFVTQVKKLPGEVKNRIGSDFDRMINEASPKTPYGHYIEYTSFDSNYFIKTKDPQLASASLLDLDKVKEDYRVCDAVFRDLYYIDPKRYKEMFYPLPPKK